MIDRQQIINLRGRDYPLFAGILDAATHAGLRSLTTRIVQMPTAENGHLAVVMARAEFEDGRVFEDVGDAGPANCSPQIAAASLRMASTRAKGRCLRDAINCGITMFEELPDEEKNGGCARAESAPAETAPSTASGHAAGCERCGRLLTAAQETLSNNKWGQLLCHQHQRELKGNGKADMPFPGPERRP